MGLQLRIHWIDWARLKKGWKISHQALHCYGCFDRSVTFFYDNGLLAFSPHVVCFPHITSSLSTLEACRVMNTPATLAVLPRTYM
jgi:hypothetical protein